MRRIVATTGGDGRAVVLEDGPPPHVVNPEGLPGVQLVDIWASAPLPSVPFTGTDPSLDMPITPAPGETAFRLVRIAPGGGMSMHRTATVDYIAVLSGRVILDTEGTQEIELSAGDCVVQLGARHAWRSDTGCVLVAVVVGAQDRA
jgi:quercetin dioxygenase-like cupin family protein